MSIDVHKVVRKHFGFRGRHDNLPMSSPRGNRGNLADCFNELGFRKGVEVGTQRGLYARVLLTQIPEGRLTCVDPWEAYSWIAKEGQEKRYARAMENLQPFLDEGRLTIIKKRSMDALPDIEDGSLDYVFVDGNHRFDYACPDIIFWSQKVRTGGIVAVHDYYHFKWAGVVQAVDAYISAHDIRPWYVTREHDPTAFWVKP